MKALLSRHNYWPDMGEDIEAYVKSCQQDKSERRREAGLLQPLPVPERPWQSRQADREDQWFAVGVSPSLCVGFAEELVKFT